MLAPSKTIETPFVNSVTTSDFKSQKNLEGNPYWSRGWNQDELLPSSGYFTDVAISHSSLDDIDRELENTQYKDHLTQRVWPIVDQYFGLSSRRMSSDSESSEEASGSLAETAIADPDLNGIQFYIVYGTNRFPVELFNALVDLQEASDEANEEGFPCPSDVALLSANRLLREMFKLAPRRYEVYPTSDGEIAIDVPGGFGRSVVVLCDSEGGALCLVNMYGNLRRARYSNAEILPDGFVREALAELQSESDKPE